jgi:hypothetical protein
MTVSKAIYTILSEDSTLTTVIGVGRVFPVVAKTTQAFPFVIYDITQDNPVQTKDGLDTCYIRVYRLEVMGYAEDYATLSSISRAIRGALNRTPSYPATTYNGIKLQSINYININDEFDPDSGKTGAYRTRLQFEVREITTQS